MAITLTILASADLGINPVVPATVTIDPQLPVVAATVEAGTTTTGAPGSDASVVNSGTAVNAVFDFTIPRGDKGEQGDAATISVGTTTTLAAGSSATVSNSGTTNDAIFNFGIPQGIQGIQGIQGNAATIAAGTTTTGEAGTNASVTNVGTSSAAIFNFTIPRGDKGDKGDTGNTGPQGPAGVMYATSPLSLDTETATLSIDLAGYATESWVTSQGYLTDAPSDGSFYARKDATWQTITQPDNAATQLTAGVVTTNPGSGPGTTYASLYYTGTGGLGWSGTVATRQITNGFGETVDTNPVSGQFLKFNASNNLEWADIPSGLPAGGDAGASLLKVDATDYNVTWGTPALASHSETTQATVRNNTGVTLTPGQIVYINGAIGNRPTVALAQANSEATSAGTYAMVEAAILDNTDGVVITSGTVMNLDTSGLTDGDKLYLSPTVAGGWTTTKPAAPYHMVYIGTVTRAHPTLGTIQLRIQNGYELEELHNVSISFPANDNLLAYENSTSLWKNKSAFDLGIMLGQNNLADITSASVARTNLGLGTMATQTATNYLAKADNLSGLASTSTARTNLGLGTIATFNDAPSDGSQYARQNGAWAVVTGGGGGSGGTDVQIFGSSTTSGSYTWTKPSGAKWVRVILIGGGGGGGSGKCNATTLARAGGGGGAGGTVFLGELDATSLPGTVTGSVGAGGAGGNSQILNGFDGLNGTAGGSTTFNNFQAVGGTNGNGGTVTSGSVGLGRSSHAQILTIVAGSAATGTTTNGNTPTAANTIFMPTGGGGGGGAAANVTTSTNGGAGGTMQASISVAGIISSIAGGSGGVGSTSTQSTAGTSSTQKGIIAGTGGGGGFYVSGAGNGTLNSGGAGGWPGGGGGGGGAVNDTFTSGKGGAGANGVAIIITYY